jgi:hypothetical protein
MEFRLLYRGPLKATGSKEDKHEIRRKLHPQLKELWNHEPLKSLLYADRYLATPISEEKYGKLQVTEHLIRVGEYRFIPLVRQEFDLFAKVDVLLLRPEPAGAIVKPGGDIDNRLKTLFDALRMPIEENEIPNGAAPEPGEDPFYCLLKDDVLITSVAVETDRLLDYDSQHEGPSTVSLVIRVQVRGTRVTYCNIGVIA